MNAVIADNKAGPESLQLKRSIICCGRRSSGPPDEPRAKLRMAFFASSSLTCGWLPSESGLAGVFRFVGAKECLLIS